MVCTHGADHKQQEATLVDISKKTGINVSNYGDLAGCVQCCTCNLCPPDAKSPRNLNGCGGRVCPIASGFTCGTCELSLKNVAKAVCTGVTER